MDGRRGQVRVTAKTSLHWDTGVAEHIFDDNPLLQLEPKYTACAQRLLGKPDVPGSYRL